MPRSLLRTALLAVLATAIVGISAHAGTTSPASGYRVLSRWQLGGTGGWDYLSFDAQRRHLFVSRGNRVLVLDADNGKQVGTIADTDGVHGIALAPDLDRGFTSDGKSASVTVFDLATLKTVAVVSGTGKNPDAIVYDPSSHHVFTFNGHSNSASVIDTTKNLVIDTIPLPGRPEFAVADGAGHVYANIEDKSELVQIDSHTDKLLHTWPLAPCHSPSSLAIDTAHHRLFSVCDNNLMAVLDARDGQRVAMVPIGDDPDAVVFNPATSMIYSANGGSGTITAVHENSPDQYRVTATIPTQRSARTLALDPQKHRLYLSAAQWSKTTKANGRHDIVPGSFSVLVVGRP